MSKILRKTAQLFGSTAGGSEMGEFGSFANGTPTYSTDPAVIQSSNWLGGWFAAILGNDNPCIEDFNSAFLVFAYQIAYMLQAGISEWDTNTIYYIGSMAQDGLGNVYTSLTDNNTGNALTSTANWANAFTGAGTVEIWPVATPKTGYLICDGSSLLRTSYPALFAAIGTTHGSADGTHFNIPDYRGQFLRGVDAGSGRDPDTSSRTAMNSGGNTGDNVGSVQSGQYVSHTHGPGSLTTGGESVGHTHTVWYPNDTNHTVQSGGGTTGILQGATATSPISSNVSNDHTHSVASGVTGANGGNETRPTNAYVNFIIKY